MLDYAVKLTVTPWAMERGDVDRLHKHGFDDCDVLDINQITAYFAYVNRVADGLGVVTDDYAVDAYRAIWRDEDDEPGIGATSTPLTAAP